MFGYLLELYESVDEADNERLRYLLDFFKAPEDLGSCNLTTGSVMVFPMNERVSNFVDKSDYHEGLVFDNILL